MCELLLDWPGCDPLARAAADKNTALNWAAQEGNVAALRAILQRFPHIDLNVRGPMQATPLLQAASHGKADVARELLKRGANALMRDKGGRTPALAAAMIGDVETIKVFDRRRLLEDRIMAPGMTAFSALHLAAWEGKLEACKAISAIAPHLRKVLIQGRSPKMVATLRGHNLVAAVL
jgi:Ankyrin repeats (3 copies)